MSELKARTARSIADEEEMLELGADCPIEPTQVYIKSEADKVIAELKAENAKLKGMLDVWNTYKILGNTNKKLRHHKYKRCLAMARWCDSEMNYWYDRIEMEQCPRFKFFARWQKRWLELAERFKEAK